MFFSRLLLGVVLISSANAVFAQGFPAPAPIPEKPAPKPKPTPTPVPTPTATPLMLDDPQPSEEPIIIGEPVRNQLKPQKPPLKATQPEKAVAARAIVAGVEITKLADGAAVAKMKAALEPRLNDPIRLIIGDYQYTFKRSELGASIPYWPLMREARIAGTVGLRLQVDEKKLEKALRELDVSVRADFMNMALNIGGSKVRVTEALESTPPKASCVMLTITVADAPIPTPTPEPKEQVSTPKSGTGKYPYLISSFSTRYDASLRGRTTNLRMAASNINGTIVAPGKVFSTNNAIGPRNAASGWREAKMFVSGQVVSGTGAGICQASSTLYNAVLRANFPVVERHPHSMRVMYVPPSLDAALMWGSKDFKFRNDASAPVKVETSVSGGKFHVKIWGQQPRSLPKIDIRSKTISRSNGTRSEAYKVMNGKSVRLSRDYYKPHP